LSPLPAMVCSIAPNPALFSRVVLGGMVLALPAEMSPNSSTRPCTGMSSEAGFDFASAALANSTQRQETMIARNMMVRFITGSTQAKSIVVVDAPQSPVSRDHDT